MNNLKKYLPHTIILTAALGSVGYFVWQNRNLADETKIEGVKEKQANVTVKGTVKGAAGMEISLDFP